MSTLEERFDYIGKYEEIDCFDVEHALERFHKRFPDLDENIFHKVLKEGMEKIKRVFKLKYNHYMIVSFKTNVKIQIEIRKDRHNSKTIGAIATVLHRSEQPKNAKNDQDVYVENIMKDFDNNPSEYTRYDGLGVDVTNYNIITVEVD